MANWASTSYIIEGPKETLKKIYDAILHHDVEEGSSENWQGNVLNTLNIMWEPRSVKQDGSEVIFSGYYMRGFIQEDTVELNDTTLSFDAEEAWGLTDFYKCLKNTFSEIKIYWIVQEDGCEVYATNDKEGKYFIDRFYVDTCIDGDYQQEYFTLKSDVYKWLHEITNGRIDTEEKVEEFNENCDEDDYIYIHEFTIEEE